MLLLLAGAGGARSDADEESGVGAVAGDVRDDDSLLGVQSLSGGGLSAEGEAAGHGMPPWCELGRLLKTLLLLLIAGRRTGALDCGRGVADGRGGEARWVRGGAGGGGGADARTGGCAAGETAR